MEGILKNGWKLFEIILRKVIGGICSIFGIKISDKRWKRFIQFVKFGIVGLSNTLISYFVYVVAVWIGLNYLLGNILGFVVSVLNSFYWNNKYVFKKKSNETRPLFKSLVKTFISYGFTGLVLSSILLFFWVNIFHISKYIAPIINLLITIPLNFIINKLWAFKVSKKKE